MRSNEEINIDISGLLDKLVVHMNGRDIYAILQAAKASWKPSTEASTKLCTGIHALAEQLGCCESTVYMLKREGVLDGAVVSHIGKKIVFDVEKAREEAEKYKNEKRAK